MDRNPSLKVVKLDPKRGEAGSADKICREVLENYLGKEVLMDSVVIGMIDRDGMVHTEFYAGVNIFALLGVSEYLNKRVIDMIEDQ